MTSQPSQNKQEREKIVKSVKEYVVDYLKREKPWVLIMDEEILRFCKNRRNGSINFSVRVYQGKAQNVVVEILPSSKTVKFTFK